MAAEHEQRPGGGASCDPKDVLGIACEGERYRKQSEVSGEAEADLKKFKTQYDMARVEFNKANDSAIAILRVVAEKLATIEDQIACHVEDNMRSCLRDRVCEVLDELQECDPAPAGCCLQELPTEQPSQQDGQPDQAGRPTLSDLTGLIAELRRVTDANTACMERLGKEPQEHGKRITELEAEVSTLLNDVNAEGRDYRRLYVRWYLAKVRAARSARIGGFKDVDDYVDCLCRTLVAIGGGWRQIITLEGERAYLECAASSQQASCELKRENIVDEVLGRCAGTGQGQGDETPPDQQPEGRDCGYGHGHNDMHRQHEHAHLA